MLNESHYLHFNLFLFIVDQHNNLTVNSKWNNTIHNKIIKRETINTNTATQKITTKTTTIVTTSKQKYTKSDNKTSTINDYRLIEIEVFLFLWNVKLWLS